MDICLTSECLPLKFPSFTQKNRCIVVGGAKFPVSADACLFISLEIYHHFCNTADPFVIDISSAQINGEDICSSMEKLLSMLDGAEISILPNELPSFCFILRAIRNYQLLNSISLGSAKKIRLLSTFWSLIDEDQSPQTFSFNVGPSSFKCSNLLASYLTPLALSSKSLSIASTPEAFAEVFSLLSAETIAPSSDGQLISIAEQLENPQLIRSLSSESILHSEEAKAKISETFFYHNSLSEPSRSFIAQNLYRLPLSSFSSISLPSLTAILSSSELKVENEDQLFKFILSEIDARGPSATSLLTLVRYDRLSPALIEAFLKKFDLSSLDQTVWKSICRRLGEEVVSVSTEGRYSFKWPCSALSDVRDLDQKLNNAKEQYQKVCERVSKMTDIPGMYRILNQEFENLSIFSSNGEDLFVGRIADNETRSYFWNDASHIHYGPDGRLCFKSNSGVVGLQSLENQGFESIKFFFTNEGTIADENGNVIEASLAESQEIRLAIAAPNGSVKQKWTRVSVNRSP